MKKLHIIAAFLLVMMMYSCQAASPGIDRFVPETAFAVIVSESPDTLLANSETLAKTLGLDAVFGGKDLKSFLDSMLESEDAPFAMADLDLAKASGASVFSVSGKEEPSVLVFIPVKGGKATYDKMKSKLENGEMVSWFQDGYILVTNKDGEITGPIQKKSKAVSTLKLAGKDAITLWVDFDQLRGAYKDMFEKLKKELDDELSVSPGATQEELQSKASIEVFKKIAMDFMDQTKTARIDFSFNKDGVVLKTFLDFEKSKSIHDFLKKIPAGKNVLKDLKYSPTDSMLAFAWDLDQSLFLDFAKEIYTDEFFSLLGLGDGTGSEFMTTMKEATMLMGTKGAGSIGLSLDLAALKGTNPEADDFVTVVTDALKIKINAAYDIKDVQGYKKFQKKMMGNGSFTAKIFEALAETSGIKLGFKSEDKKNATFDFVETKVDIGIGDSEKFRGSSMAEMKIVTDLLNSYPILTTFSKNRMYMSMSDPAALKTYVEKDGFEDNLTKAVEFAKFEKIAPAGAQYVSYLNAGLIAKIAVQVAEMDALSGSVPDNMPGLYGYTSVKDNACENGLYMPIDELKGWVGLASVGAMFFMNK